MIGILSFKKFNYFLDDWIGKIDGVNYNLGGKFVIDCVKCSVKISTNNFLEKRNVSNVIGVLKGNVEPDR